MLQQCYKFYKRYFNSLLTSGQEKKVCKYQSTVLMLQGSAAFKPFKCYDWGKLHTIQGHSQDKPLIAFRRIRTGEPQNCFQI